MILPTLISFVLGLLLVAVIFGAPGVAAVLAFFAVQTLAAAIILLMAIKAGML